MKRVEAGRRLFPSIWFNAEPCSPGLDALGWYHEKHDEARNIGLGPSTTGHLTAPMPLD
jgi:phage terminase large subunit